MTAKASASKRNLPTKVKSLGKELRQNLRKDQRERIWKVLMKIEACLFRKDIIGTYELICPWYRKYNEYAPVPSEESLEDVRNTYQDLFANEHFEQDVVFDFKYWKTPINDDLPSEEELGEALKMRNRKAPGLTRITVDHLKRWYQGTYPENEDQEVNQDCVMNWGIVSEIVWESLETGITPSFFNYGTLILIPKDDKRGFRGIGLLETIHKLILAIINLQAATAIDCCPEVHDFRCCHGCFMVIGEAKLRMQKAMCHGTTVFQVYLDLRKAYNSIDRKRFWY